MHIPWNLTKTRKLNSVSQIPNSTVIVVLKKNSSKFWAKMTSAFIIWLVHILILFLVYSSLKGAYHDIFHKKKKRDSRTVSCLTLKSMCPPRAKIDACSLSPKPLLPLRSRIDTSSLSPKSIFISRARIDSGNMCLTLAMAPASKPSSLPKIDGDGAGTQETVIIKAPYV